MVFNCTESCTQFNSVIVTQNSNAITVEVILQLHNFQLNMAYSKITTLSDPKSQNISSDHLNSFSDNTDQIRLHLTTGVVKRVYNVSFFLIINVRLLLSFSFNTHLLYLFTNVS